MKKHLVMAVVPLLAIGCGKDPTDANGDGIADGIRDPNNVSVVVPATPKGTVSGQVLDSRYSPLDGVTVSMTIGSSAQPKTAATDSTGNFVFPDVPGGAQVLLTFTRNGYAPLRTAATVPSTAGNVPLNNGNANIGAVILGSSDSTVKFGLIGPNGRPAAQAKATLSIDTAGRIVSSSGSNASSSVVVEAESSAEGIVTFDKVPSPNEMDRLGSSYRLVVNATDTNGDGVIDTGGIVRNFSGADIATGSYAYVHPLELPYAYDPNMGLSISYSSLRSFSGGSFKPQFNMLKPGEALYFSFNQPIQPASLVVQMTDEYGRELLSVNKALSMGNTVLTVTPAQNISVGQEYNLYLRAASLSGANSVTQTHAFYAGDVSTPPNNVAVVSANYEESAGGINGLLDPNENIYVNFNQVLAFDYGTAPSEVFFNADFNGSNKIGDAIGELGYEGGVPFSGFPLLPADPVGPIRTKTPAETPVFPLLNTGYTTRFYFTYGGKQLNPSLLFPTATIKFKRVAPQSSVYTTAWGIQQQTDLTFATLTALPIPTPAP
ncbi:carboxypeptidase regulatory-like domain-containing protein [Corallococcus sp. H22C18031201]|uniref:carboxypeptidase-like regulatory domain-containing protein n=1 Tax=Citreicoccus inhibens TaxID=2849499 RepID=UPI000E7082FB|nr:carboxypeptidase-like regulatory domain-containing protein [Citreicoccus inhibens]MBU8895835.1 carboxypeptidase-like regulatory domain-containing protein [Citreicoccus inhibens]RJS20243.1 carboxypeptidase regulatory-like domain-containing protein [Corallococcus sp. H22C18031201]